MPKPSRDSDPQGPPSRPSIRLPDAGEQLLAGAGERFFARLLDGVLLVALLMPLVIAAQVSAEDPEAASLNLPIWLLLVPVLLYDPLLLRWRGATVGKMIVGLKVLRVDTGQVPTMDKAMMRTVLLVLFGLPLWALPDPFHLLGLAVVGALVVAITQQPRRQGWHDRAASTVVVNARESRRDN